MASQTEKKWLNLDAAKTHFEKCLEISRNSGGKIPANLKYEYASLLVMTLDIDRAVTSLESILKEEPFKMYTTAAALLSGCYVLRGERDRAEKVWRDIVARFGKSSASADVSIVKRFNSYLAGNTGHFALFETLYFRRDLPKMATLGQKLIDSLNKVALAAGVITESGDLVSTGSPSTGMTSSQPVKTGFSLRGLVKNLGKESENIDYAGDNRSTYLMMKSVIIKAVRSIDDPEAIALLDDVLKMPPTSFPGKWQRPYAYYELCESYAKRGETERAVEMLRRCIECRDYLWEDPLKVRIRVTTEQLNKMSTGVQLSDESPASGVTSPTMKSVDDDDEGDGVRPLASPK